MSSNVASDVTGQSGQLSVGTTGSQGHSKGKPKLPRNLDQRPQATTQTVEKEIWEIISAEKPEGTARAGFRQLVIDRTEAVGACHVIRDNDGNWDVKPDHSTGRVPRRHDFSQELAALCESVAAKQSPQIHRPTFFPDMQLILFPILVSGSQPEILLSTIPASANIGLTLMNLEKICKGVQYWKKANQSNRADWKLNSLAMLVELVSRIEDSDHSAAAAEVVATELSLHLGCKVAVGIGGHRRQKLQAISGLPKIDRSTRQSWAFQQVLTEALLRDKDGVVPVEESGDDLLLLSHKQLATNLQVESVRSRLLKTSEEIVVGSLVFAGETALIKNERLKKFLDASAPRIASALHVVKRSERSKVFRFVQQIPKQFRKAKTLAAAVICALFLGLLCCEFTYRVRCECVIQPTDRRFAVAPFDGLVQETHVKPGDPVSAGQVLATMDGRSVRWELSGISAEKKQAQKTRDMELTNRNVSKALLAELEERRLDAKQKVLKYQEENLDIRSPIEGIVLSGSPEKNNAASVSTGDMLFEIAPTNQLKIEISIPAEEIASVEPGMPLTIWIDGFESKPFSGQIDRIYPRSEVRNSENVFVAEFIIENANGVFRPGMSGAVRIDSHRRPLAWNLFHKPYDYLISRWLN